jgi:SAM-dependent methyltransferase
MFSRFGARQGGRAIDIGCGCGGNLAVFDDLASSLVVGVDLSPLALGLARLEKSDAALVLANLCAELPLAEGSFDIGTLFNVLYHEWVDDDRAVLERIIRLLRPGGLLLVTEPAFDALRRSMDRVVMGKRRYTRASFRKVAEAAGFEVVFASYLTSFAFPFALGGGLIHRLRGRKSVDDFASLEFSPLAAAINEAAFRVAACEADAIAAGWRLPFGVGLVAMLRRPADG